MINEAISDKIRKKPQFYNDAQRQGMGIDMNKVNEKKIIPNMSGTKKSACIGH